MRKPRTAAHERDVHGLLSGGVPAGADRQHWVATALCSSEPNSLSTAPGGQCGAGQLDHGATGDGQIDIVLGGHVGDDAADLMRSALVTSTSWTPGTDPAAKNSRFTGIVIVNSGGTGNLNRAISVRPAPFPPSRFADACTVAARSRT